MVISDVNEAAVALAEAISSASRIVTLTGAGISTECGVPDFRSPGSPWLVHKPIPYQAFIASEEARREAWRRKFAMDDHFRGAQPGRGHAALRRLYEVGRLFCVITQNIDNLHQASGLPDEAVIELHGNGTYATCLSCGLRHELDNLRAAFEADGQPPYCGLCQGPVKSATIAFGQSMPAREMRRAFSAVEGCTLFIAVGSSLMVNPAARIPVIAKGTGADLIIVNREPTPADGDADLLIRADIGTVLEKCVGSLLDGT